jgi:anionic cell wall polymer biosynthesis LytR-Cps2A-Psr (LCP) family protein
MFAFIDVVNILGGIDVELAEDLVDPTYKVKNKDGTWSTLFYPKGMHHLDGVETLRLARSRHSSSDFDRSSRQQQILEALKNRVEDLDIRDMGKAYDLVRTLSSYVQTNFTFFELVDIFSRYQKTPITRQEVLSTKNVLYTTYSNVYLLKVEEASAAVPSENGEGTEVQKEHQVGEALAAEGREDATEQAPETIDEDFDKGAWILLPLNDDWNLIKWYIRTLIGGEKNE